MSDNGLSFNSYEFQQFATNYDMEHVTSSPHYPESNGKVEMLSRPLRVHWRNLKLQDQNLSSPTRMLKHALWKSVEFPSTKDVRAPNSNTDTSELLKPKIVEEETAARKYYNVSAKPTDKYGQWYKARIEKQADVRSYKIINVRNEDGRIFRINRRHLRSSKGSVCSSNNPVSFSMPDVTSTAPLSPSKPVPGTSQEFSPPKEATAAEKPNTSLNPADVSMPSMPIKPVGLPVTRSGRTSRPPSHLKDFIVSKEALPG